MIHCQHWTHCDSIDGGCCSIGEGGGRPSRGVCEDCTKLKPGLPIADLTGFDPETEIRTLRNGGCCGAAAAASGE